MVSLTAPAAAAAVDICAPPQARPPPDPAVALDSQVPENRQGLPAEPREGVREGRRTMASRLGGPPPEAAAPSAFPGDCTSIGFLLYAAGLQSQAETAFSMHMRQTVALRHRTTAKEKGGDCYCHALQTFDTIPVQARSCGSNLRLRRRPCSSRRCASTRTACTSAPSGRTTTSCRAAAISLRWVPVCDVFLFVCLFAQGTPPPGL